MTSLSCYLLLFIVVIVILLFIVVLLLFRRSLDFFDSCHHSKVRSCDSDCSCNAGELIIKIPKDTYGSLGSGEKEGFSKIEFSLHDHVLLYSQDVLMGRGGGLLLSRLILQRW